MTEPKKTRDSKKQIDKICHFRKTEFIQDSSSPGKSWRGNVRSCGFPEQVLACVLHEPFLRKVNFSHIYRNNLLQICNDGLKPHVFLKLPIQYNVWGIFFFFLILLKLDLCRVWKQQISGNPQTSQEKLKKELSLSRRSDSLGPLSAELCVANARIISEIIETLSFLVHYLKI